MTELKVWEEKVGARTAWLVLVRAACLTLLKNGSEAITVTERFTDLGPAHVEQLSRSARHLAGEYGLTAETEQDGLVLTVRLSAKPSVQVVGAAQPEASSAPRRTFGFLSRLRKAPSGAPVEAKQ